MILAALPDGPDGGADHHLPVGGRRHVVATERGGDGRRIDQSRRGDRRAAVEADPMIARILLPPGRGEQVGAEATGAAGAQAGARAGAGARAEAEAGAGVGAGAPARVGAGAVVIAVAVAVEIRTMASRCGESATGNDLPLDRGILKRYDILGAAIIPATYCGCIPCCL